MLANVMVVNSAGIVASNTMLGSSVIVLHV